MRSPRHSGAGRTNMNKIDFMRQLERLLQNISEQERQEALQYYGDYFDDAGPENEQAVIEALGNPARVAENIKRDLYGAGYGDGDKARKPVTGRELTEYGTNMEESAEDADQNGTGQGAAAQSAVSRETTAQDAAVQGMAARDTVSQGAVTQGAAENVAPQGAAAQSTIPQGAAAQNTAAQSTIPQGTTAQNTAAQGTAAQNNAAPGMEAQGTAAYDISSHGIPGTASGAGVAAAAAAAPWQGVSQPAAPWNYGGQDSRSKSEKAKKEPLSGGIIALIIVLCIFCLPVAAGLLGGLVGLLAGAVGVVLGLLAAWFCMILGFGITALICIIVGFFLAVVGIVGLGFHPMAALGLIGGGLLVVGIGIFFLLLTVAMAGMATPAIFRGIGRLFSRKKKRA